MGGKVMCEFDVDQYIEDKYPNPAEIIKPKDSE